MATTTAATSTVRTAAEKQNLEMKQRVAAAWTMARTMLPNAPEAALLKFATAQLALDTVTLKAALRQTAVNAHHTRIAESREQVHKEDLNDKLPESSELSKEEAAVKAEVKGKAVAAGSKKADDRKENGEQPATYDEGKRTEPTETDASKAGDRDKDTVDKSDSNEKIKAAAKKKCPGGKCPGCVGCKSAKKDEKDEKDEKKDAKKAGVKKAEGEEPEKGGEKAPPFEKKPEGEEAPADDAPADEPGEGDEVPANDEAPADDAPAKDEPEFDPEKTDVLEAIDEAKDAIQHIEDAITEEEGQDLDVPGLLGGEGDEGQVDDQFADQGEGDELDVNAIFGDGDMDQKVDSLANEDDEMGIMAAFDGDGFEGLETGAGDEDGNLFGFDPTDAGVMEAQLDQEDSLSDPASMFAPSADAADPLAALFASVKTADDKVLKPGTLADAFETDINGHEDRDADADHEGDLLAEIADSLKDIDSGQGKRDQAADLKEPGKKAAGKKAAPVMRVLKPSDPANKTASTRTLAGLLFQDDDQF